MRMPCLAPTPVPTITAVGVAKPSAHGHATTITEMAKLKASLVMLSLLCTAPLPKRIIHVTSVTIAASTIAGTNLAAILSAKGQSTNTLVWSVYVSE